jgi:hypothetical protein
VSAAGRRPTVMYRLSNAQSARSRVIGQLPRA